MFTHCRKNNTQRSPVSSAQVSAMSNCSPYRLEHWLDMVQDTHFHHHNYPPGCLFIAMITYLQLSPPPNIWQPFNCYLSSISINVPFQKCQMSGMTKYVILWVWSFSLRVTLLRFIHIVSWINDSLCYWVAFLGGKISKFYDPMLKSICVVCGYETHQQEKETKARKPSMNRWLSRALCHHLYPQFHSLLTGHWELGGLAKGSIPGWRANS